MTISAVVDLPDFLFVKLLLFESIAAKPTFSIIKALSLASLLFPLEELALLLDGNGS